MKILFFCIVFIPEVSERCQLYCLGACEANSYSKFCLCPQEGFVFQVRLPNLFLPYICRILQDDEVVCTYNFSLFCDTDGYIEASLK